MYVYPESQPDYYNQKFNLENYQKNLNILVAYDKSNSISLNDGEFSLISTIEAIWEKIKGWLGFKNSTNVFKLNAEVLKFLNYGLQKKYFKDESVIESLKALQRKIVSKENSLDLRINNCITTLLSNQDHATKQNEVKNHLIQYSRLHQGDLTPCFWDRLFSVKTVLIPAKPEFGDTYLAIAQETHDLNLALHCIEMATKSQQSIEPTYHKRLKVSVNNIILRNRFEISLYKEKINKIYLNLAKREFSINNFSEAEAYVNKVTQKNLFHLKPQFELIKIQSLITKNHLTEVENLLNNSNYSHLKKKYHKLYIQTLLRLGDLFLEKSRTLTSKAKKIISFGIFNNSPELFKVINYYLRAFHSELSKDKQMILSKITPLLDLMQSENLKLTEIQKEFEVTANNLFQKKQWKEAAYFYLFTMKCMPSSLIMSDTGIVNIRYRFTKSILELFRQDKAESITCLNLLNSAIEHPEKFNEKNIEKCIKKSESTLTTAKGKNKKSLVYGSFIQDQGAGLYFLKARLLELTDASMPYDILKCYEMAQKLAPNNPFGGWGYFAEDDQINSTSLTDQIRVAKKCAIEFGASEGIDI